MAFTDLQEGILEEFSNRSYLRKELFREDYFVVKDPERSKESKQEDRKNVFYRAKEMEYQRKRRATPEGRAVQKAAEARRIASGKHKEYLKTWRAAVKAKKEAGLFEGKRCSKRDCTRHVHAKGLCPYHYDQSRVSKSSLKRRVVDGPSQHTTKLDALQLTG